MTNERIFDLKNCITTDAKTLNEENYIKSLNIVKLLAYQIKNGCTESEKYILTNTAREAAKDFLNSIGEPILSFTYKEFSEGSK